MDDWQVLIVGCGARGEALGRAWLKVPGARVVEVVDPDIARAAKLAQELGGCANSADFRQAIPRSGANVVTVATPCCLHRDVSIMAAEHGMHIFSEKPLAFTVAECDEVIAAARAAGVTLAVCHARRHTSTHCKTIQLVREGAIGRPLMVRWHSLAEVRPKILMHAKYGNGGPVLDMGTHFFDYLRYLFASEATRVSAWGCIFALDKERVRPIDLLAIDTASMNVEYASGDVASISISWGLPPEVKGPGLFDILGPDGIITPGNKQVTLVRQGGETETFEFEPEDVNLTPLLDFVAAIREQRAPVVTGEDGCEAVRVSLAAIDAAESGDPVLIRRP